MPNTILWSLDSCEYANNPIDGLSQVVVSANCRVNAIDEVIMQPIGIHLLTVKLDAPSPASFTPLDQVTSAMVIQWSKDALGPDDVASAEAAAAADLDVKLNPPTTPYNPPA